MSRGRRLEMIDRDHPKLSLVRQCALLGVSRSSVYYLPAQTDGNDLELMSLIDRQSVPGDALLRLQADDILAQVAGAWGQSQASAKADASDGDQNDLPTPEHQQTLARPRGIPVPVTRS